LKVDGSSRTNGLRPSPQDLEELDPDFIMAKQVEQLEKEKRELQERLKNQEKKVQYAAALTPVRNVSRLDR